MTVGRGCHQKAARGGWGAASLGRLWTDLIFDSGDRGPGTTRELSLIFRRGTLFSEGGERSSTCPKDFSLGDGGGTRTRRDTSCASVQYFGQSPFFQDLSAMAPQQNQFQVLNVQF